MNNKKGFTLIETVIVIGVLAVIMVTVTNVMLSSFRARSRVEIGDKLEQNGNSVLAELKNNILTSDGRNVDCPIGGVDTSIGYINKLDGVGTTLICIEGSRVASSSGAVDRRLTSEDVIVRGCSTFVSCDTLPSSTDTISVVNFKFVVATSTMPSIGIADTLSRSFEAKVVIR